MPPLSNTAAHMRVCAHTQSLTHTHTHPSPSDYTHSGWVNSNRVNKKGKHRTCCISQQSLTSEISGREFRSLPLFNYFFLNFRIFNKSCLHSNFQSWCPRAGIWPAFIPHKLQINVVTRCSCHTDINPTEGLRGSTLLTWQHIQVVKEMLPALCGTACKTSDTRGWNDDMITNLHAINLCLCRRVVIKWERDEKIISSMHNMSIQTD